MRRRTTGSIWRAGGIAAGALLLAALVPALGAAVAPAAVPSPASSSSPYASPSPSPSLAPALTLSALPARVTCGAAALLTVRLGVAGATLQLQRRPAGATEFVSCQALVTDGRGVATCRVAPRATTAYAVSFAGDAQLAPASAETTVTVRPRLRLTATAAVYRGARARLHLRVAPMHPGAAVAIEQRRGGAWTVWRTVTLGADSGATCWWPAASAGRESFRAVMAADDAHAAGASGVCRVRVSPPNPYRVPVTAPRIVVVDLSQYRLSFFSYGREVRSFPCVLGRPSLPTPRGHFRIYAKGMNPGGPYGARIMSYHPPCAIHGTNEPWLLSRFPRDFSHGCTRLSNANAIWLYDHCPLGTPVWNVP